MKRKMISLAVVTVFVGALLGCVVHGPLFGPPPLREEVASAQPTRDRGATGCPDTGINGDGIGNGFLDIGGERRPLL